MTDLDGQLSRRRSLGARAKPNARSTRTPPERPRRRIFAVDDGVGGADRAVASQTAIEVLPQAFQHHKDATTRRPDGIAIQRARLDPKVARKRASDDGATIVALNTQGCADLGHSATRDSKLRRTGA